MGRPRTGKLTKASTRGPSKGKVTKTKKQKASSFSTPAECSSRATLLPSLLGVNKEALPTPEQEWTQKEVKVLRQTRQNMNPANKYFWEEVAAQVSRDCGTKRTAKSCLDKYHELCQANSGGRKKHSNAKKEIKVKKDNDQELNLSLEGFSVGTNKRKRMLRSMVKKVEQNHRDDFFASLSPKREDLSPSLNFSDEDSFLLEGPLLNPSHSLPSSVNSSPEILQRIDRNEVDGYISQITKKILKGRRISHEPIELSPKDTTQCSKKSIDLSASHNNVRLASNESFSEV